MCEAAPYSQNNSCPQLHSASQDRLSSAVPGAETKMPRAWGLGADGQSRTGAVGVIGAVLTAICSFCAKTLRVWSQDQSPLTTSRLQPIH